MKKLTRLLMAVVGLVLTVSSAQVMSAVTFYHHDALGSIVATSDQFGSITLNEEYQPYGEKIYSAEDPVSGNEDWYTGKNYSKELDLTYFGARWYDAKQGRFLSVDPAPVTYANIHTFNRYHYVNNNPYKYVDPDGRNAAFAFTPVVVPGDMDATLRVSHEVNKGAMAGGLIGLATMVLGPKEIIQETFSQVIGVDVPLPSLKNGIKETTTVIGRVKDLQKLNRNEKSLLDRLPDQGGPKANWKQNSGVLRQEMGKGRSIRDASPGDKSGQFLNAERNLLESRGWAYDNSTNYWNPPK